jgi:hypothetical protein
LASRKEISKETNNRFQKPAIASQSRVFCWINNVAAQVGGWKETKMNAKRQKLLANFGPETRFEVRPAPPAPFRALQENLFERLKSRLVTERLEDAWTPELSSDVRRAAHEAAALAWVTPYPLLLFPALFQERLEAASQIAQRQKQVRQRSRELLVL